MYDLERGRCIVVGQRLAGLDYEQIDAGGHRLDADARRVVGRVHERAESGRVAFIERQVLHLEL